MKRTTKYILNQVAANQLSPDEAQSMLRELQSRENDSGEVQETAPAASSGAAKSNSSESTKANLGGQTFSKVAMANSPELARATSLEVAIVGMAGKFPKADNLDEYWFNVTQGVNCIDHYPETRKKEYLDQCAKSAFTRILTDFAPEDLDSRDDDRYVKGGYLNEVDKFDAAFFRIPPKEAIFMDPLQRVFLETAFEAMEDAGYGGKKLYGGQVGVFVGKDHTAPTMYRHMTEPDPMHLTGSWTGILASRISYIFNFQGPSMVIDTACSSGLVAVHEACRALANQECDLAIAGGVHFQLFPIKKGSNLVMDMVESHDGYVRTFDKNANGTVWGEGVGAVILKPLSNALRDRDQIYAVIKGSAINNDGASSGITAPNAEAQKNVIIQAWKGARIDPETIAYIEAHGTGTNLGDPIEIKGLSSAFGEYTAKKQFCGIGSVKTNVGHLVAASGMASLMKVVLALKHQILPPTINFETPNPYINFNDSPFYVNDRIREWVPAGDSPKDAVPRRAGISSFGFSGTNCHMVLEEAPTNPRENATGQNRPGILTLSARNQNLLRELIRRYHDFLHRTPQPAWADVCYTANTGRGHYPVRLAVVAESIPAFQQKISRLMAAPDLESFQEPGIYFGAHKIAADHKTGRAENELTENDRRQLNALAAQKMRQFIAAQDQSRIFPEFAEAVCRLYVQGAVLDWEEYYQGQGLQKVSIPVYPLERIRCWAGPNLTLMEGVNPNQAPLHPLMHRLAAESFDVKIYASVFRVSEQWVLHEHRVLDYYVAPGTSYLEMARVAGQAFYKDRPVEFRDLLFTNPLVVNAGERKEVHTIVKRSPEYLDFMVVSKSASGDDLAEDSWIPHAQGKIYPVNAEDSGRPGSYNPEELKRRLMGDPRYREANFGAGSGGGAAVQPENGFLLGPRWGNLIRSMAGENEALLQLQLPEKFLDDLRDYFIHPALMDHAVNAFSQEIGEGMYLPFMYKKMTVYQRMPSAFYSYIRRKDPGSGALEVITMDVSLMDESGQVFAEILDYSIKKVHQAESRFKKLSGAENKYYGFQWLPVESPDATPVGVAPPSPVGAPPPTDAKSSATSPGAVLVFKDSGGMAARIIPKIQESGRELIEVDLGPAYQQVNESRYVITGAEADYQKLTRAVKGREITQILHFMVISTLPGPEHRSELEERLSRGLYSLFYLARAFMDINYKKPVDLVLLGNQVHEVTGGEVFLNPEQAAFFGLGKVVSLENEYLRCRAIDLDQDTTVAKIWTEILARDSNYQVAYRRNQRFIEEFGQLAMAPAQDLAVRDQGVYLITGGTGGIGLEIGKYLAGRAQGALALINRGSMPDRARWDEILEQNPDRKLAAKITAIREMERAGSQVILYCADIASETSLKPILDELRSKYGKINGVVHAAGIAGAGMMIRKDFDSFQKVMTPKIQGTWLLDKLTAADDLDFFIMFSSMTTITGGPGQSDYTAANSYLDAFASLRNRRGQKTITIDWPLWNGIGMAADYQVTDEKLIFKGLSQPKALSIFEEILGAAFIPSPADSNPSLPTSPAAKAHFQARVLPGELNYDVIIKGMGNLPFQLSGPLQTALQKHQERRRVETGSSQMEKAPKKALVVGLADPDETKTPYILAQIWARVLGLPEIDVDESFYNLGGDSILAGELFKEIDREYPDLTSISDIFSYSTVRELAELMDQKGGSGKRVEIRKNEDRLQETAPAVHPEPEVKTSAVPALEPNVPGPEVPREGLSTGLAPPTPPTPPGTRGRRPEETEVATDAPLIYRVENKWPEVKFYQRNEPEARELTLRLQREITISLHRCLPLQIILTDEKLHPWYYEHFVNIFGQIQGDGLLKLDFLEEWGNYRHLLNEVSLSADFMAEQPDIISFIINNINQGRYVNVCVDEFYMPRKMRYQKMHFVHLALVYGYDNHRRELKMIGFNAENIIDQIVYTYDEFREAYEKGKEWYQESAPWASHMAAQLFYWNSFYRPYPFNIHKFLQKLGNYLDSVPEADIVYYWNLREDQVMYGFKVVDVVLEYMENILRGSMGMDYRATHLLYEHKSAIARRLEYVIKEYGLTGRIIEMVHGYHEIVNLFQTVRLGFYELEKKFDNRELVAEQVETARGQFIQIMDQIRTGREKERVLLTEIYESLRARFQGMAG